MGLKTNVRERFGSNPKWKGVFLNKEVDVCVSKRQGRVILLIDLMTSLVPIAENANSPKSVFLLTKSYLTRLIGDFIAAKQKKTGMPYISVLCIIHVDQKTWVPSQKARTHATRRRKRKRAFSGLKNLDITRLKLVHNGLFDEVSGRTISIAPADILHSDNLWPLLFDFLEKELINNKELSELATVRFVKGDTAHVPEIKLSSRIGEAEVRAVFCAEVLYNDTDDLVIVSDDTDLLVLCLLRHKEGRLWKAFLKNTVVSIDAMWRALYKRHESWILAILLCGTDYTFKSDVLFRDSPNVIFHVTHTFLSEYLPCTFSKERFYQLIQDIKNHKKVSKFVTTTKSADAAFKDVKWLWKYWSTLQKTLPPTPLGSKLFHEVQEEEEEHEIIQLSDDSRNFRDCFPLLF